MNSVIGQSSKNILNFSIKFIFTAVALAWLFNYIDWQAMSVIFKRINWLFVVLSFMIYSLYVIPCALRWQQATLMCSRKITFSDAVYWYFIAGFFNTFLPTGHGGDIVRGILVKRKYNIPFGKVMGVILYERIIGLFIAMGFVLCVAIFIMGKIIEIRALVLSIVGLCMGLIILLYLFFTPAGKKIFLKFLAILPVHSLHSFIANMYVVMERARSDFRSIGLQIFFSVINQFIMIGSAYILKFAIPEFSVPWYSFFLVIPLMFFANLLPSIGGYGIVQVGYVILFKWFGANMDTAVVFSLVRLICGLALLLIEGALFVFGNPSMKNIREDI